MRHSVVLLGGSMIVVLAALAAALARHGSVGHFAMPSPSCQANLYRNLTHP